MFNFDGKLGAIGRVPGYLQRLLQHPPGAASTSRPRRRCAAPTASASRPRPARSGECLGEIEQRRARTPTSATPTRPPARRRCCTTSSEPGDAWFAHRRPDAAGRATATSISSTASATPSAGRARTSRPARWPRRWPPRPGVKEAKVYGVKVGDLDGRAGMAALVVGPDFDAKALRRLRRRRGCRPTPSRCSCACCPRSRSPAPSSTASSTWWREGFDPAVVKDPLYVRGPNGYQKLTRPLYAKVMSGEVRV